MLARPLPRGVDLRVQTRRAGAVHQGIVPVLLDDGRIARNRGGVQTGLDRHARRKMGEHRRRGADHQRQPRGGQQRIAHDETAQLRRLPEDILNRDQPPEAMAQQERRSL